MKEILNNPELGKENAIAVTKEFVGNNRLHQVSVSQNTTRAGKPQLMLKADKQIRVDYGSGAEKIESGDTSFLLKKIASCFEYDKANVDSLDLLEKDKFVQACIANIDEDKKVLPNKILSRFTNQKEALPVFYGSTNSLNAAEVMETLLCAQDASDKLDISSHVIFDYSALDGVVSKNILESSLNALDSESKIKAEEFISKLGEKPTEQQIVAAKIIFSGQHITFVDASELFEQIGDEMTVGKLLLLAKLSGGDPTLLGGEKSSEILRLTNATHQGKRLLDTAVSESGKQPNGFTYYARDAVLGADTVGQFVTPLKLTDKANIYKILDSYNALAQPGTNHGAILSPIQRHRIQAPSQIDRQTGDPIDIRVLAFLALEFPDQFAKLSDDFKESCRILSPEEALSVGTGDIRIDISNYFKQIK